MNRSFDWFGRFENPQLILCNPSGKELYVMPHAKEVIVMLRFNGYSELEFKVHKLAKNVEIPYYKQIESMREVKVENYSVFTIDTVDEETDGATWFKIVRCKSRNAIFSTKSLVGFKGTKRLYSPHDNDSVLGKILTLFPDWTIDRVDSDLWEEFRTYDISEQNCYDFMMNDIQEDFNCVFKFDTFNKTISVDCMKHAISKTDIYVSFENLLKQITINQSEGVTTALDVYGGDGLDINLVNPTGTSVIYNFSHYKNTDWISQNTINKITSWEDLFRVKQPIYANLLTTYKEKNTNLIKYKTELYDLHQEEKSVNDLISVRISSGQSYSDLNSKLYDVQNRISSKQAQITSEESLLKSINDSMKAINRELAFETTFTKDEMIELNSIIKQSVYQNDCYIKTSIMSDVEIQEQAQKLYDAGNTVLSRLSQPRYTFSGEIINFLAIKEFDAFSEQLELGCEMTISIDGTNCFTPILLEYTLNFDNIEQSTFTFCNDLRASNSEFDFASIFEGFQSSISNISYSKGMWEDYLTSGDKDSFNDMKNNALDLTTKDIISSDNQDFKISSYGIRGKKLGSPNEIWVTNNCIAFSRDNFATSSLALGETTINGVKSFGLIADHIVGNMIAGKSLIIKNSNNTVTIDGNGINATNANLTLLRSDGASGVYINPTDGIKIKSKINNVLTDVFYVDGVGNLNFKGNLTGATGTFSGEVKGASFIGGSININNRFKVDDGGNCTATSVKITGGNFESGSISGGSISGTTISGSRISGGSIDIDTDLYVGSQIYMKENGSLTGINFGRRSSIYNTDGFMIVRCDGFYVESPNIQLGSVSVSDIPTKSWVTDNTASILYVDREVDNINDKISDLEDYDIPYNAVYNSSSKLLKFYNRRGGLLFDVTLS